ncbi:very long chain fatty acid elongase 1 isoform X2 [Megalopta genalis]|uniref:very long chain fatty acid elongase 1 isoform X2 n=1 Tax=Megalopta genalis TaxID=115081 RepID=UPI003FD600C1
MRESSQRDQRTMNLPLVTSPIIIPSTLLAYLVIVLKLGPKYMKNREPYSLKTFIRYYNVFQVFINAYIIMQLFSAGLFSEPTRFCYLPDYSFDPNPIKIVHTFWLTMLVKLIDLAETVTFVLRKKYNQVSFLHLYHHITTLLLAWMFTKYYPMKLCAFPMAVNCAVHVFMYTYYFFSSFGDKTPKILNSIKPLITIMQMVQFFFLILHACVAYLPSCEVNKYPSHIQIANLLVNSVLFYNFYQNSYKTPKKKAN